MSGFQEEMTFHPKQNPLISDRRDIVCGACVFVENGRIEVIFGMTNLGFKVFKCV
jgi:hypothetical protein